MLEIRIDVSGGKLPEIGTAAQLRRMRGAAAGNVRQLVHDHLAARPGRSYWKEAAEATEVEEQGGELVVSVNHVGVGLHYHGGKVKPTGRISSVTGKPVKRLLVPFEDSPLRVQKAELYELGIPPQDMFVLRGKRHAVLAARRGQGEPLYLGVLLASVEISEDKTVLPDDAALLDAARAGAEKVLDL